MASFWKQVCATLVTAFSISAVALAINNANATPSDGEIRSLIRDLVYEEYPQCQNTMGRTAGDELWCYDRFTTHLDNQLNEIYTQVMTKFRLLKGKKQRIREVQRQWISYRDDECLYIDSTDGILSDKLCMIQSIGLSIHYLKRLREIQLDKEGLKLIDSVILEYKQSLS